MRKPRTDSSQARPACRADSQILIQNAFAVRMSTMREYPTDEELAAEGVPDAGRFVLKLKRDHRWDDFLAAHSRSWQDPLRQPIERCVEHQISIISW